jgi:molecular chaperone GrpE (heat shock protein)
MTEKQTLAAVHDDLGQALALHRISGDAEQLRAGIEAIREALLNELSHAGVHGAEAN